jgi:tryptophan halogenase
MTLQEDRNIRRITIVGAGTSGYLAAFWLAHRYPNKTITWIYPNENNPIGVGEALVPKSSNFLHDIGITHKDIIKFCNGTLKLGIVFDGFNTPGERFSFPFGIGVGDKHNTASIDRIINTEKIPNNILDYPDIATHFRTTELAQYLDTKVPNFPNLKIERRSVTKEELEGTYDLLIDSTGFARQVSKVENNFKDFSNIIPNNRALTARIPYTNNEKQCKPYSLFKAMEYGWCWHIPLGDRLAFGYVHNNQYDVTDEFHNHLEEYMECSIDRSVISTVNFITGRNIKHLNGNIVSIGLASTFIEPLESTGIYLIVSSIEKIGKWIDQKITEEQYNTEVNNNFDAIVNFIAAHYKYSQRDNNYWNHFKRLNVEKYVKTDIFPQEAWDYILSGFNLASRPKENIDPQELINIHRGTPYYKWIQEYDR